MVGVRQTEKRKKAEWITVLFRCVARAVVARRGVVGREVVGIG